ncbi:major capsid family protein, partial [Streptomyces sp. P17]|uniref:major capsid family protein n=1 Tax=Streptomyces sp. P17 TaxID=3074716 RepID=UPI0037DC215F
MGVFFVGEGGPYLPVYISRRGGGFFGVVGGGRMVAYRNTADVLELPMPMDYRFFPLYQDGPFNFTVPGMGRIGQIDVKKP